MLNLSFCSSIIYLLIYLFINFFFIFFIYFLFVYFFISLFLYFFISLFLLFNRFLSYCFLGLFGNESTDYEELTRVQKSFEPYSFLWQTATEWIQNSKKWLTGWSQLFSFF